ncbi:MAG: DUF4147 domain-containing protein [Xanthomonadales bacterium]|nr:DUF4147 domain-containing protein [Xanthomonadales bacterium]
MKRSLDENFPDPRAWLEGLFRAAIDATHPDRCLRGTWPARPPGRLGVIACGKAAVPMAAQAARHYGAPISGLVIRPQSDDGATGLPAGFRDYAGCHPVPGSGSVRAAEAALDFAAGLAESDLLLFLVSGGGSALMCLPPTGVGLEQKQALTRSLLACGATIAEINCVRTHLSRVKGGRLAMATTAAVETRVISDVPGNDAALVASGPTLEDSSTLGDARAVLERYSITPSAAIARALQDPENESPRFGARREKDRYAIVASGRQALEAAAAVGRASSLDVQVLGDHLQGDAAELAAEHARMALGLAARGGRHCLLSGGETTVRLGRSPGTGGRNTEYALALAIQLNGHPGIRALAADTDGIDGVGGHAGAWVEPDSLKRAVKQGLDPRSFLEANDSASWFQRIDGLFTTGPTGTNVNDFRALLILD